MAKDDNGRRQESAEHSERILIDGDDDKIVITIEFKERSKKGGGNGGGQAGQGPTATPFLLIPDGTADTGARPLPLSQALANVGILAIISNPGAANGWADYDIQLSCMVTNLGAAGSVSALAEFYVGDQFGIWNPSHQALTPAQVQANAELVGRATFIAPPGIASTVLCPNLWNPGSAAAAQKGVLAQVSDLFTDPMTAPFDGAGDRHVARNDGLMDPIIHSVTVSGTVLPNGHKTLGSYAQGVGFTDTATDQKFTATITAGAGTPEYTIFLPNSRSYLATVTWFMGAGVHEVGPLTENIGILNLNVAGQTYNYDIGW
jgi:hypothetical protein